MLRQDRSYGQLWAEGGLNNETTGLREARASRGEKGQEEAEGPTQVRNMAGGPHTRVRHSPAGKGVALHGYSRLGPLISTPAAKSEGRWAEGAGLVAEVPRPACQVGGSLRALLALR